MTAFLVKLTDLNLFFNYSRDVAMATDFEQNLQYDLHLVVWRSGTVKKMASTIQKCSKAIL